MVDMADEEETKEADDESADLEMTVEVLICFKTSKVFDFVW